MAKELHYRKCHVCGTVNEQANPIIKCSHCHKSLAPFFYFDDKSKVVPSDQLLRPPTIEGEFSPIHGLTVYWEYF
ncbi:MAG: hypothetical protein KDD34_06415 [Bdellovibrionales bacterium]|nr:hypothetical protein [Bdellovibrionales bacterium]